MNRIIQPLNISTIIVNYKSHTLTITGLATLLAEKEASPNLDVQAIVVENDSGEFNQLQSAIKEKGWQDWVTVIDSDKNGGFGYGNNLGFQYALSQGPVDYFYLLNPDARCYPGCVSELVHSLEQDKSAGIAGSSFTNADSSPWPIAFRFPSLLSEIERGFRLGLVSKLLHKSRVAIDMRQHSGEIDWVAGASMMLRSDLVQRLNGFDESFFLYYEETDFCKRAKRLGLRTIYAPESKALHIAGQSTKVTERDAKRKRFPAYWYQSRSIYLLKNHGLFYAIAADILLLSSHLLGNLRLLLFRKPIETPIGFCRDVLLNTIFSASVYKKLKFRSLLLK